MIQNMSSKPLKALILKTLKITAMVAFAVAFVVLTVILAPKILTLQDPAVRESVRAKVDAAGMKGVVAVFLLQVIQVVIAFVPGEPVELLCGFLYGTFGGLLLCLVGIAAGTALVFTFARFFGRRYIGAFVDSDKYKKLAFLRNPVRRDAMFFLLFLIPGTPKDVLTYFAPLTKIPLARFIAISCMGRIPSLISSTFIGSNIKEGNFLFSALVFVIFGALGLVGIVIYNRVIEKYRKRKPADRGKPPAADNVPK